MRSPLRVLELFCGIGGCAAALGQRAHVVAAIDVNRAALDIYAHNFSHATVARTIESIPCADYRQWESDLWWLSPPCQPYTRRGRQRDLADPRAAGLLAVIDRIPQLLPPYIANRELCRGRPMSWTGSWTDVQLTPKAIDFRHAPAYYAVLKLRTTSSDSLLWKV